jgi:uncharacterized damage-inducible protein DinB
MRENKLPVPSGYDGATQATVATLAAGLDDQLRRLREQVDGLSVEQLEWQAHPGRNTIGMLLTHLAAVEVGWIVISAAGKSWKTEGIAYFRELLGVEDDGIPLPKDGTHPEPLRGFSLERYDQMLTAARARIHEELQGWSDASLDEAFQLEGRKGPVQFSRRWTLYHVLEHFAAHLGQISLIKHAMRDHGILSTER